MVINKLSNFPIISDGFVNMVAKFSGFCFRKTSTPATINTVKNEKIINEGGLRNKKEFVNHKILDLAGDFVLSGYRILGKVSCYQGGHLLSNLFLKKLLKSKNSYSEIAFEEIVVTKKKTVNHISKIAANA